MKLLERIDFDRGHIKRSAWMKEAAEFYLKYKGKPMLTDQFEPKNEEVPNINIESFLDSIN